MGSGIFVCGGRVFGGHIFTSPLRSLLLSGHSKGSKQRRNRPANHSYCCSKQSALIGDCLQSSWLRLAIPRAESIQKTVGRL